MFLKIELITSFENVICLFIVFILLFELLWCFRKEGSDFFVNNVLLLIKQKLAEDKALEGGFLFWRLIECLILIFFGLVERVLRRDEEANDWNLFFLMELFEIDIFVACNELFSWDNSNVLLKFFEEDVDFVGKNLWKENYPDLICSI